MVRGREVGCRERRDVEAEALGCREAEEVCGSLATWPRLGILGDGRRMARLIERGDVPSAVELSEGYELSCVQPVAS